MMISHLQIKEPYIFGDVIKIINRHYWGPGNAWHTMYITGYKDNDYLITYHSSNKTGVTLKEFCKNYPNQYIRFYKIK